MTWSHETRTEMVRMRESGATYSAIARKFETTTHAVAGVIRRSYVPQKVKRSLTMTADEIKAAVDMRENGDAFNIIARELQRSPDLVSRTLKATGYGKITPSWTPEMETTTRKMWKAGSSAAEIATVLGVSASAVSNKITRMGLDGRVSKRYRSPRSRKRYGAETGTWDSRVFEPWSVYRARRKAERQKMREMCDA